MYDNRVMRCISLMASDRAIGGVLIAAAVIGIIVYFWLLFIAPQTFGEWIVLLVLEITAFIAVALALGVVGYIGYTLATTPPPVPPEELEKMLKEEEERIKKELEKGEEEKKEG